ncbi:hypothetical protein HY025_03290, partial [Candidatus Daviesbacteria bacterium]|nr:hypothetical protein [Candidatus Daviesbacteria bacterium]
METREDIKRGIDLKNRLGGGKAVKNFQSVLVHWDSGKLNTVSFLFIGLVFLFNLFLILPFFNLDVSGSFSSSALILVANFLDSLGLIDRQHFFSLIVVMALSIAPICFYLFVRTMVL